MSFISKLVKEGKIKIIEPNDNVSESYSQKSTNSFKAAKLLLEQSLFEESVSMSYYSMYHKTIALFYLIGVKCENHTATIFLLKEIFDIDNKDIKFAKTERIDKQYYTDFILTQEDAEKLLDLAEIFVSVLEAYIDELNSSKRNDLLNKAKEMLK